LRLRLHSKEPLMPREHVISRAPTLKKKIYIYTHERSHLMPGQGLRLSNLLTSRRFGKTRFGPGGGGWRNPSHTGWRDRSMGAWRALSRGSHDQTVPPLFNSDEPPPGACHLANGSSGCSVEQLVCLVLRSFYWLVLGMDCSSE
jgi:hypothetical protein